MFNSHTCDWDPQNSWIVTNSWPAAIKISIGRLTCLVISDLSDIKVSMRAQAWKKKFHWVDLNAFIHWPIKGMNEMVSWCVSTEWIKFLLGSWLTNTDAKFLRILSLLALWEIFPKLNDPTLAPYLLVSTAFCLTQEDWQLFHYISQVA